MTRYKQGYEFKVESVEKLEHDLLTCQEQNKEYQKKISDLNASHVSKTQLLGERQTQMDALKASMKKSQEEKK